jgi:hypothetical protein
VKYSGIYLKTPQPRASYGKDARGPIRAHFKWTAIQCWRGVSRALSEPGVCRVPGVSTVEIRGHVFLVLHYYGFAIIVGGR